jgi:hypothetical protein
VPGLFDFNERINGMKPIKTKRIIRVPGVLPLTWIETDEDLTVTNETVIRKFLKQKSLRDEKLKFQRWTGRDNL